MFSTPAVAGDLVMIGSCNSRMQALDRHTGELVWLYDISQDGNQTSFHGDGIVVDDLLLIGTDGPAEPDGTGHVYAFEWKTGTVRWRFEAPAREFGMRGVASDIQVLGDRVYATTLTDEFLCLDRATGEMIWSFATEYREDDRLLRGGAAITESTIYFGGRDGIVYALDPKDGSMHWKSSLASSIQSSMLITPQGVVVGTTDGEIFYLDPDDGTIRSSFPLGGSISEPIVAVGGALLVCVDWLQGSYLSCVDDSLTELRWDIPSPEERSWSSQRPYLVGENVLLADTEGGLYQYRIADAAIIWSTQLDGAIRGILVTDDTIYAGNQDGTLFAVRYSLLRPAD